MAESNCLIAHSNQTDAAVLSGGSWVESLPITNLQDRIMARAARSVDLDPGHTQITATIGKDRMIRVIALGHHNLSVGATIRISGIVDGGDWANPNFVEEAEVWPPLYDRDSMLWETPNFWFGGLPTDDDIKRYPRNFIWLLKKPEFMRAWRIEIFDANNQDGYVEIGRLFLMSGWQPVKNMSFGAGIGIETSTTVEQAASGIEFFDRKKSIRVARFTLGFMDYGEAWNHAFDIDYQSGIDEELIFIWSTTESPSRRMRRSFPGRLRALSEIEVPNCRFSRKTYEIKEII